MTTPTLTDLERAVAIRVLLKQDPWEGDYSHAQRTRVEAALTRLRRKGVVYGHEGNRVVAEEWREILGGLRLVQGGAK